MYKCVKTQYYKRKSIEKLQVDIKKKPSILLEIRNAQKTKKGWK